MKQIVGTILTAYFVYSGIGAAGEVDKTDRVGININIPGERPFDAVNIFGDFGMSNRLRDPFENKVWWERIIRGEIGRDRYLVLCALKDGNWRKVNEIRDRVEFSIRETYPTLRLRKFLVLLAGRPVIRAPNRHPQKPAYGEGWLEKKRGTDQGRLGSAWRIEPSVYPLLYFLLLGCPESESCAR